MKLRVITAFILALTMIFSAGCGKKTETNKTDTNISSSEPAKEGYAYESEHCKITDGMLQFMFFFDFYNQYAGYTEYYGLDLNLTFSEQIYSSNTSEESMTWQEHLIANTKANTENAIYYAEAAAAEGFNAADLDGQVEQQLKNWEEAGAALGLTLEDYIKSYYGENITEKTVRNALEILLYASEYKESLSESYCNSLSDEDYDGYYEEHRTEYEIVDVLTYSIPINYNGIIQEEARDSLMAAGTESPEKFKEWVADYMTEKNSLLDTPKTVAALEESIAEKTATVKSYYTEGGEFSEWAFAPERQVGDTFYLEKNDGMYHIYLITATAYPYLTYTKNFMHIYCSLESNGSADGAKAKAEELYAEWKAGEMTKESFEALAQTYNDDPEGAYHENSQNGFISGDFNSWLFDKSRVEGDHTVVASDYGGYHVVYYIGDGIPEWKAQARTDMTDIYTDELSKEYEERFGDSIKKNDASYDGLPDIIPEGARSILTD